VIYGPYPPLAAEHPIVTTGEKCGECGQTFIAGDVVCLQPMEGQAPDDGNLQCLPIHWSCASEHAERVPWTRSPARLPKRLL
jgi:hypothetical protein